jgi:mRNA-degrading endonuclease HigB of HigAB toxin-antitoxin module
MVLNDADGIGIQTSSDKAGGPLTTADVSNDILTQDIKPSLSMDDFISSALKEAVNEIGDSSVMISYTGSGRTEDIAKTAGQLLQNEELRKDIEKIFDVAGEKLRLEVEAIKKEQVRVSIKNCGVHDNRSQHRRLPWKQLHYLSMHFHLTGIGHTEWIKARPRLSIF